MASEQKRHLFADQLCVYCGVLSVSDEATRSCVRPALPPTPPALGPCESCNGWGRRFSFVREEYEDCPKCKGWGSTVPTEAPRP